MNTVHVLKLQGEIDISRKLTLERELDQVETYGSNAFVIIDLSAVTYLDTTLLNALVNLRNRLATQQPDIRFCLVAPHTSMIWRVLEITKLRTTFRLFDTLDSARQVGELFSSSQALASTMAIPTVRFEQEAAERAFSS